MRPMTTVLLTGFGPFPGAPFNPTGLLVEALACGRPPGIGAVRRVAHVFPTSYEAVDRELPALLARERPDVLLMFGLSWRARMLRIESRARNVLSPVLPDADGQWPKSATIAPDAPAMLPLSATAPRLVAAARGTGMPAALSRDAGSYLCNYLCWRVGEAAQPRPAANRVRACPPCAPGKGHWAPTTAVRLRISSTPARRSCGPRCVRRVPNPDFPCVNFDNSSARYPDPAHATGPQICARSFSGGLPWTSTAATFLPSAPPPP